MYSVYYFYFFVEAVTNIRTAISPRTLILFVESVAITLGDSYFKNESPINKIISSFSLSESEYVGYKKPLALTENESSSTWPMSPKEHQKLIVERKENEYLGQSNHHSKDCIRTFKIGVVVIVKCTL